MSAPAVLDLFRGAGGWSVACRELGLEDHGVECMDEANRTAEAAGFKTAFLNVWEPPGWIMLTTWTGLIASPPCQTFSQAGSGSGRKALDDVLRAIKDERWRTLEDLKALGEEVGDERTALVLTPLYYALILNPEWVALEQVPTVLPVWEAIAEVLASMGYNVWTGVLHSEQYGVPQTRKRAILLASRTREVHQPVPTHSKYHARSPERLDEGVLPWVSMAEALGWGEEDKIGFPRKYDGRGEPVTIGDEEYRGRDLRDGDQPSFVVTEKARSWDRYFSGAGNYAADRVGQQPRNPEQPAHTITGKGTAYWVAPEWAFKRPSTTIVGSFRPDVVAAPGYRTTVSRQNAPNSARVTAQEAGILQSFPADYPWQGSKTKQFLQVGNAVPPRMARAILEVVQP